jgi:haloacid dehalogenase-like hydrolase
VQGGRKSAELIELYTLLAEKLRKIRLVLMDFDGTLIRADKSTFDNVLVQLRKLRRLRIGFSIATGRTIAGASFVGKPKEGRRDLVARRQKIEWGSLGHSWAQDCSLSNRRAREALACYQLHCNLSQKDRPKRPEGMLLWLRAILQLARKNVGSLELEENPLHVSS